MNLEGNSPSIGARRRLTLDKDKSFEAQHTEIFNKSETHARQSEDNVSDVSNEDLFIVGLNQEDNERDKIWYGNGFINIPKKECNIPVEVHNKRVVLDAIDLSNMTEKRIDRCQSPQDYFEVGRDKGRAEGLIEGYILAMFNNGTDIDSVSKKLVLTFNLTPQSAEDYLREFYTKRNIKFEEM